MKKLLSTFCLILGLILTTGMNGYAQQGNISLGGGLMYGSGAGGNLSSINNDLGLMVDGYYTITDKIRAGAGFGYFFPKSEGGGDFTVTEFNINGHYIFLDDVSFNVYGLAGINITSFKFDVEAAGFSASTSASETGLNIGIGGEYGMGFGNLFGELKYAGLGGQADELVLGAGIRVVVN